PRKYSRNREILFSGESGGCVALFAGNPGGTAVESFARYCRLSSDKAEIWESIRAISSLMPSLSGGSCMYLAAMICL
ncbi:MAG: hypothetical protein Q8O90_10030, partial [Elusimicrobiota bacterium]|nr:hypothetical protein [Elusimicrobiota bacterium]